MSCALKTGRESQFRRSGGKEFHSWGAERLKALPPIVLRRAGGTERWMEEEDRTGGDVDVQEVRQVGRGEVVDGHECEQEEFVVDTVSYGEPVELLEDRGDVMV